MKRRAYISVWFIVACSCTSSTRPASLASLSAPPSAVTATEWLEKASGYRCSASAERSANGCTITRCTESFPADGGDGEYTSGYGEVRAACNETVRVCGSDYFCKCEMCEPEPDYATRMSRGRKATFSPPTDKGILLFEVRYDGGKCEGAADSHYGAKDECQAGAWDKSRVGGCLRESYDDNSGTFGCGETRELCDGLALTCDCSLPGPNRFRITGAEQLERKCSGK
jgi:hypothetical protein